jgi:hypothetical protein
MPRPIFKDISVQKEFDSKGFVIVNYIEKDQVKELLDFYNENLPGEDNSQGFHISLEESESSKVKLISDKIHSVMSVALEDHFDQCKVFIASYLVKEPGDRFVVPPHQDWSCTKEPEFLSVHVWTPLMHVDSSNGALGVIHGSNKFFNYPRVSPSPQSINPLEKHAFKLLKFVDVKELEPGQALIYDSATLHASFPNLSDKPRVAVGIGVMAKEAPMYHYYQNPLSESDEVLVYKVDRDFYHHYNNPLLSKYYDNGQILSDLELVDRIKRNLPNPSETELEQMVMQVESNNSYPQIEDRFKHLFSELEQNGILKEEKIGLVLSDNKDTRTFRETYTVSNILAEIRHRLNG